jgi:excisionase family DNA binding protein
MHKSAAPDTLSQSREETSAEELRGRISYSVTEVALVIPLSERHIWTLIKSGELPSILRGGRRMVLREELEQWLRNGRQEVA